MMDQMELDFMEEGTPQKASEETIEQLSRLYNKYLELRDRADEIKQQQSAVNSLIKEAEQKIILMLDTHNLNNFREKGKKMVSIRNNVSVTVPKGDDKDKFFAYLKEIGREDLLTVHSGKLKTFYNEKFDEAKEKGDFEFRIPGVTEPKIYQSLSLKS